MDNDGDASPTFWFQQPIATRRRPPSPFLNPVALIIILPILALLLIFFFLPPFLNHTSHFLNFKPNSVQKSWDSLNICLVVFAILCGLLSRKNDDVPSSADDGGGGQVNQFSNSNESQWGDYIDGDREVYSSSVQETVTDNSRLRRNSSSYPDLRQESLWDTGYNRFRGDDDFGVNLYSATPAYAQQPTRRREAERENVIHRPQNVLHRSQSAESVYLEGVRRRSELARASVLHRSLPSSRRSKVERENVLYRSQSTISDYFDAEREFSVEKEIPVDTFEIHRYSRPPPSPPQLPAPPPPPPPPPASFNRRQSYQSVKRKVKVIFDTESEAELEKLRRPPPTPPPPPPPPPPPASFTRRSQQKHKKLERQLSEATKEIATAITSLYNQTKRKKKHRKRNIYEHATVSPPSANSSPEQATPPPPAPPPLPPPPSVLHTIFKKGTKQKRIHSVAASTLPPPQSQPPTPPPPPPPPPSSIFNNLFKSGSKSKRFISSAAPSRPSSSPSLPPSSILNNMFKTGSRSKRHSPAVYPPQPPPPPRWESQTPPPTIIPPPTQLIPDPLRRRPSSKGKPPRPTKASNYYERDEYLNSGSQSPLYPIPPPLPPFTMPEMKFKIRGDFVSIQSAQSSVCNSPDRDDVNFSPSMQEQLDESDGGEVIGPVFFPSPDVNTKADNFISRHKNEWRMEKVNSTK